MPAIDLKTWGLESGVGRALVAGQQLLRAGVSRNPYTRADALLRGWRATHYPWLVRRVSAFVRGRLQPDGTLVTLRENPFLRGFVDHPAIVHSRRRAAAFDAADRVRIRRPRPDLPPDREGDLILLKAPDDRTGDMGAVLIKYNDSIARFAAMFEIERLIERYFIVLEPSWWGYEDAAFFNYVGADAGVVVQAQAEADFEFITHNGFNLTPVRIGAGDWVDPELFAPAGHERIFDVVMVSSWHPFKQHARLLAAVRDIKRRRGRSLRVALVGYPNGWDVAVIRRMVEQHGLEDQCEIFNAVPQSKVAEIVSRSRLYVLLSRREGANKAMYEAMFCDTPVLAPADHRGVNRDHLNAETGLTFGRHDLAPSIEAALARTGGFSPRAWALRNTGYPRATEALNRALGALAARRGLVWERQAVPKMNQPNLKYARGEDRVALEPHYARLEDYLRPV